MAPLKVLICGGGCAGPALAFWLIRLGHQVTIVERFPALRATGAQIDFREQGIATLKLMGIIDEIRAKLVDEAGVAFVDTNGKILGTVLANTSGKGAQSITSEFEIMRGDVVRILYDATKEDVKYIFNTTVEKFEQNDKSVLAHFSDGTSDTFDILVGADGQGSRIRKAIAPADTPDPYRKLGIHMAFENYDKVLRPFVDEVQNIKIGLIRRAIPDTQLGVTIIQWIAWFVCLLRIPYLISRFSSEEKAGWPLPKYPALKAIN